MIKVMTLNIWGFSEPYQDRMRLIRNWIEQENPDLMAFQEAGYYNGKDQIRELLTGFDYHICHQLDDIDKCQYNEGVCIVSRWPISMKTVCSLKLTPKCSGYPYAALAAQIDAPPPIGKLLFVNSKPSWELDREYERELQAIHVVKMIRELTGHEGFPTILAGDFDAVPNSASIRFFKGQQSLDNCSTHFLDAWEQAGDGSPGHTWTFENKYAAEIIDRVIRQQKHARRIDYIFLASPHDHPDHPVIIRNCHIVLNQPENGVWPSDHFGVCAEVEPL